jgi:hypothetical protein
VTLTGHIDFLQIRNGAIHIVDYKPGAKSEKPIPQLMTYSLALSRRTGLRLFHFVCSWFDQDHYYQFFRCMSSTSADRRPMARSPRTYVPIPSNRAEKKVGLAREGKTASPKDNPQGECGVLCLRGLLLILRPSVISADHATRGKLPSRADYFSISSYPFAVG